ncbi:hypothetical protein FQZ97_794110 [compost metagenome]
MPGIDQLLHLVAALAERARRFAKLLAEPEDEMRGIGEARRIGDLCDVLVGVHEQFFRMVQTQLTPVLSR